jgi:hypothetical protein
MADTSDLERSYKMDKVIFIELENLNGKWEHAIIEHADGSFTSMLKSTYEAQQAEQSTPNLAGGE